MWRVTLTAEQRAMLGALELAVAPMHFDALVEVVTTTAHKGRAYLIARGLVRAGFATSRGMLYEITEAGLAALVGER
jgi:hypothetical protein